MSYVVSNNKIIHQEYRDGTWCKKIYYAENRKLKKTNKRKNIIVDPGKNWNNRSLAKLQVLGNIGII